MSTRCWASAPTAWPRCDAVFWSRQTRLRSASRNDDPIIRPGERGAKSCRPGDRVDLVRDLAEHRIAGLQERRARFLVSEGRRECHPGDPAVLDVHPGRHALAFVLADDSLDAD